MLTQQELRRIARIEQIAENAYNINVGPGLLVESQKGLGVQLALQERPPQRKWLQIINGNESETNPYSYNSIYPVVLGGYITESTANYGAEPGNTVFRPAYERQGRTDVPTGFKAITEWHALSSSASVLEEFIFDYQMLTAKSTTNTGAVVGNTAYYGVAQLQFDNTQFTLTNTNNGFPWNVYVTTRTRWAKISAVTTVGGIPVYTWSEVTEATGGTWVTVAGGLSGSPSNQPLYERNNFTVPLGSIVRLFYGYLNAASPLQEFICDYEPGTAASSAASAASTVIHWAKITAVASNVYSWYEVTEGTGGTWTTVVGGLSGTPTNQPLYERNGFTIPIGSIVRLFTGFLNVGSPGQEYVCDYETIVSVSASSSGGSAASGSKASAGSGSASASSSACNPTAFVISVACVLGQNLIQYNTQTIGPGDLACNGVSGNVLTFDPTGQTGMSWLGGVFSAGVGSPSSTFGISGMYYFDELNLVLYKAQ